MLMIDEGQRPTCHQITIGLSLTRAHPKVLMQSLMEGMAHQARLFVIIDISSADIDQNGYENIGINLVGQATDNPRYENTELVFFCITEFILSHNNPLFCS